MQPVETVLKHIERCTWGAPTSEEIEHDKTARQHFVKYCENCPVAANLGTWHEGICLECDKNPYIMIKSV